MSRHTFTRRNGTRFTIELTIDVEKIAEDIARKLAASSTTRATKSAGGIVAVIVEDTKTID